MCYCGNTGVEQILKWESAQQIDLVENFYPAGTQTHNLLITSPAFYHWAIPPPHSAKSTGGSRLHLNKDTPSVTPMTQQSQSGLTLLSRHSVGTHQGNKLTYSSPGNTGPQSSQFAEPLWTDPWPERVELQHTSWSPLKKHTKKGASGVIDERSSLPYREKATTTTALYNVACMIALNAGVFVSVCVWYSRVFIVGVMYT